MIALALAPLELQDFVVEINTQNDGALKHVATRAVRTGGAREAINAAVCYAYGARAELDHDMAHTDGEWIHGTVGGHRVTTRTVWIRVTPGKPATPAFKAPQA